MAKAKGESLWAWLDDPDFGPLERIGIVISGERPDFPGHSTNKLM